MDLNMPGTPLVEGIVADILAFDDNDSRFEQFCVTLFSACDGHMYVTTSRSWDLGQDGRDMALNTSDESPFISCSQNKDISPKVDKDIRRLAENFKPKLLRYCSSQKLSEHAVVGIEKTLKSMAPSLEMTNVVGAKHIAEIVTREASFSSIFEKHYAGELNNWRTALSQSGGSESAQADGMRLALTTQLTPSGDKLKAEITRNMIITTLADGDERNASTIARQISHHLHLGKNIDASYFQSAIDSLDADGLIVKQGDTFGISENGRRAVEEYTESGSRNLASGARVVRQAIADLTDHALTEKEFQEVWGVIQTDVSAMFYQHGMQVIEAVASITRSEHGRTVGDGLAEQINSLAQHVTSMLQGGPRAKDIGQAVADMLFDANCPASGWFTDICTCYIAICSLGLESTAQRSIAARLSSIDLLVDTDVLLSYFCGGEPSHSSTVEVLRAWRTAGGAILVPTAVLEEVAYHAWIAEQDFKEVFHQLGRYTTEDAHRQIVNAFVRGYWTEAKSKGINYSTASWREYIHNYRGREPYDYTPIENDLSASGFTVVTGDAVDHAASAAAAEAISKRLRGYKRNTDVSLTKREADKADRDGRVIALLKRRRANRRGDGGSAIIATSANILREACLADPELGEGPQPAMPLAAVACLLSFAPGAHVSLFSLKKLFFNPGFKDGLSGIQRKAMRIIYESSEYSLPFSRRPRLQSEIIDRMANIAAERGQSLPDLAERLEMDEAPEYLDLLGGIVRDSVDAVTRSRSENEITRLQNQVELLQKENQALRSTQTGK
jgi:predicted nucleic acid-binding protein